MKQLKDVMMNIREHGTGRMTRTGGVTSLWNQTMEFDLQEGFPAVTSKKLPFQTMLGELIWFLSGSRHLRDLKHYTFGNANSDRWTIWTDDANRWNREMQNGDDEYVGNLYPVQWRNYNNSGVDQIANLVEGLRNNPFERNHVVSAWNPQANAENSLALKACHMMFQCYVTQGGRLNLHWTQRSADLFLGIPLNVSSYATLTHILAHLTGLEVGILSATLMDAHIYDDHTEQVDQYINNYGHKLPTLIMPDFKEIDDVLQFTAKDFTLDNYKHEGVIKAPLSVGS